MIGLGGRETLLRLRQGYHLNLEEGGDSLEVMAVPRCNTCKHWKNPYNQNGKMFGFCGRAKAMDEPEEGILCQAHSPKGILLTPGDWGCVRWEAKR